ncbi:uncharacterized protein [Nicotiana sylvestris]|uniref:uncharacterized protein n=1 Tax=Nicotiana sylvestris TaxID=4096 RepID=UPI00388C82C8
MAQNQPLGADLFGNIDPEQGRPLDDYARPVYNQGLSSVRPPPVAANNFKLKQWLLQPLQNCYVFRGKQNEDPNNHLMDFEEIMNTFHYNGVSQDAIYLRAFPFTLKDNEKHWLRSLSQSSIRTWEEITRKFLAKYFSSAKMGKFKREIHNFYPNDTEIVFEACEGFKEIVRKCQHSGIELWMQLQDFWDDLTLASCRTLSNAAGGSLMKKSPEEIAIILDELSEDANHWPSEIAERRRSVSIHQVDTNTSVQVQLDAIDKEISKLALASKHNEPHTTHDICGRGHPTHECQASMEEVNVVGTLPADTEKNHKETVNVVTLRSGQVLKGPTPVQKEVVPEKESRKELKIEDDKKKKGKKGANKKKKQETSRREEHDVSEHMHALSFLQKLYREKLDKKFERFLDMLRHVNVNLPFTEVISQMTTYAKFLKDILTKKRKIEETSVVKLIEHCSAILQNKLPQKCEDPGSFTISCSLGTLKFDKSLCDSGASINLMPLSI